MKLKISQFIIEREYSLNQTLLFHTLLRSLTLVDRLLYEKLKQELEDNYTPTVFSANLIDLGILIDCSIDEYKWYLFKINKEIFERRFFSFTFLVTRECNLKCEYCYENNNLGGNINKELIKDMIFFLRKIFEHKKTKFLDFTFFGGEPLLNIDAISQVSLQIKELSNEMSFKYSLHIVTNGYLLSNKNLKVLKRVGIESMQITLDGDRDFHDVNRHLKDGGPTFDVIYENMINAINMDFEITLNMNYDQRNFRSATQLLNRIPLELKEKIYIKFNEIIKTEDNKVISLSEQEKPFIKNALYNTSSLKPFKMEDIEFIDDGPCLFKKKNTVIMNTNGDLSKCLFGLDDKRFNIGNIKDPDILRKFNFYSLPFKESVYSESCKKCCVLPFCKGLCFREKLTRMDSIICPKKGFLEGEINYILNSVK